MIKQSLPQRMNESIAAILPTVRALRHTLHQTPELALQETKTSALLREVLAVTGMRLWEPLLGTDVIGEIPGHTSTTICLRADIDAVQGDEQTSVPYISHTPGMMHACGHDGHMAILAGTAMVLTHLQASLPLSVRLIFQPGEEIMCAGKTLVELGACDGACAAFALHGWPGLPAGVISSKVGPFFAAGTEFNISIHGKGCHGAMPEKGLNPIPIAAELITRFDDLYHEHRQYDSVLSICITQSGSSVNVIPNIARLQGTLRYLRESAGQLLMTQMREIVTRIAAKYQTEIELEFLRAYELPVVNTEAGYAWARSAVENEGSRLSWLEASAPTMAMEDFAYYLPGREGAMVWLGLGESSSALHTPTFNFNDDTLATGIAFFCALCFNPPTNVIL